MGQRRAGGLRSRSGHAISNAGESADPALGNDQLACAFVESSLLLPVLNVVGPLVEEGGEESLYGGGPKERGGR